MLVSYLGWFLNIIHLYKIFTNSRAQVFTTFSSQTIEIAMNNKQTPSIAQANLVSPISPNLNYASVLKELKKHDDLYLAAPQSIEITLREMIKDMESLNRTNNFDFTPVQALVAKIEHLDPIDIKNNFKIQEILTKVWRFVKNYNFMNKVLFYDTLASVSHPLNPTMIGATLVMFYAPHIKNMDDIYHKVYQPKF